MWLDNWGGIKHGKWVHASAVDCSISSANPSIIDQMDAAGVAFTPKAQGVPG
jgi:hypothetical protein